MATSLPFDPNTPCERCGHFGAFPFDGNKLCGDCYESRGSCCPEGAADEEPDAPHCAAPPASPPTA